MRQVALLLGAVFLVYMGASLLHTGLDDHTKDGGSHLGVFIGGAIFGIIGLLALLQGLGVVGHRRPRS